MSNTPTTTATGKNAAGEDVTIEIPIPEVNTANAWNEAMQTGAQKAGVEIPGVTEKPAAAAVAPVTEKKEDDQPKLYRASLTVNGKEMVFEGDAAQVLSQYTSAVEAAQLAMPAASTTQQPTTEQKPALSAADMFDIGTKLIGGDASGLDTLLEKSGAIGRYLESQGVSIEKLKAATEKQQSDSVHDAWTTATNQFLEKVKAGEIDYISNPKNRELMGITLAQLGLKPSAESMVKAWEHLKSKGLYFSAETTTQQTTTQQTTTQTTTEKKTAPSSTAIGASGGARTETKPQPGTRPKLELNMAEMSTRDFMTAYNAAIDQGYKENVDLFIKQ